MDYSALLDLATEIGYRLALSGAETFRVEESINRILGTYGIQSETFAIPNCMTVSIETADGTPMTRMRRIGFHGNDLDSVERYSNLSRRICAQHPDPKTAEEWLKETESSHLIYSLPLFLVGDFLGAFGFSIFYGGTLADGLCAGICGILIGLITFAMDNLHANPFFRTIIAAFVMAAAAYILGFVGIADNAGCVIIGSLMILVPGLLFTNAMRDIIYGDTNSGINRIVQVFLIAVAIALGTAAAWNSANALLGLPDNPAAISYSFWTQNVACLIGCTGFAILFNIHGPGGILCTIGGILSWCTYCLSLRLCGSELISYFWAAVISSAYSESMARIRKYPAISYLVVSIFPLIPGASIYYTMNHAVQGDMELFASRGMYTVAIAGYISVGILLVSTAVRLYGVWMAKRKHSHN